MESKANDLKAIQTLYKALLVGQLLFAAIAFVITRTKNGGLAFDDPSISNIFLIIAIALAIVCVSSSYILFRKKISDINQQDDLSIKLQGYRAALILQLALAEAPTLLAIIFFMLTGSSYLLILVVALLLNFLNLYPSKNKLAQQLELNDQEQAMFE